MAKSTFIDLPHASWKKGLIKIFPIPIIYAIKKICKLYNINCIHYLTGEFTLAFSSLIAFNKNKYTFYYTVHNLHPHQYGKMSIKQWILDKYINLGNKINLLNIHNITTSSQQQYQELCNKYPHKKITFTSFPSLVTNEIIQGDKIVQELKNTNNYILFFGSISYYKGVDLLLEAHQQYFPNETIVIAGKGNINMPLNKNIIRLNRFIDDSEIKYLFKNAKLIVYPYRSATMSGVLSIAYYFKKAVITSDVPFFLENKSPNTQTFHIGDIKDLANKILKQKKINFQEIIENDFYEKKYSKQTLINEYLNLY